jgi:hypothetical protein
MRLCARTQLALYVCLALHSVRTPTNLPRFQRRTTRSRNIGEILRQIDIFRPINDFRDIFADIVSRNQIWVILDEEIPEREEHLLFGGVDDGVDVA